MNAVILCAGFATRMYPLTRNFPKPLLPVGGMPVLDYLVEQVAGEIAKLWRYNTASAPKKELALDGQISNWVRRDEGKGGLVYIDTSTPLLRLGGVEQLDPEPLLKSAPAFLRWILKWLFMDDVMNRYYNHRQVLVDIAANFYYLSFGGRH